MKKLLKLPAGIPSFESIRRDGYLYVDKTRHIYQMADGGMYYFMSRPRRFGKSLTVSVLKNLFQGKKELFEGLWIAEYGEWEWEARPVILLDFNEISHDTPENMEAGLHSSLKNTGQLYGIDLKESLLKEQFKELILSLCRKTGTRVTVLIDEYDKPMIDHLGKGEKALETAKANRDVLKHFLGVLKGGEVSSVLRFVFLTGVSKFSRVSVFSELNNLKDLTMNRNYADMMGYTQEELETCFADHIGEFSRETGQTPEQIKKTLKAQYDGYRFSEKDVRVYNPFSVLMALDEKAFKNYWFETGTPAFLVNLLRERNWYLPEIENLKLGELSFAAYDIERLEPEPLLFQTGYITIRDVENQIYTFEYPNQEVKASFLKYLLFSFMPGAAGGTRSKFLLLSEYLRAENYDAFFETVSAIFASVPYVLESKRDEAYFHTLFYLMVCASGADARSEILTCKGRIDLVIEFSDKIFIIEFKCGQTADAAIQQIRDKAYDQKFRQSGKKLILMGIRFDTEKRNVAEWKIA